MLGWFDGETDVDGDALKPQMLPTETVAVCNREEGVQGVGVAVLAQNAIKSLNAASPWLHVHH